LGNTFAIFETKHQKWWRRLDSNQRTRKRADLQSAAINHSATPPQGTHDYLRNEVMSQVQFRGFAAIPAAQIGHFFEQIF
jgi:hypothetical protein